MTPLCVRPGCNRAGAGTADQLCHPHRRAAGLHRHDGNEARAHVKTCQDNGWSLHMIGQKAGLSDATMFRLMRGNGGIASSTHNAILAVDPGDTRAGFREPLGARRRTQALLAAGWRRRDLANLYGVGEDAVRDLVNENLPTIREKTDLAVRRVYSAIEWCPTRKPSPTVAARAWPLPAEWDGLDMDNPGHYPHPTATAGVDTYDPVLVDRVHEHITRAEGNKRNLRTHPERVNPNDIPRAAKALADRGHNITNIASALGTTTTRLAQHIGG